jgi:amino acid permease
MPSRALLVPFEIVALSLMIGYWTDVMPAAAVVVIMMVIYLFVARPRLPPHKVTLLANREPAS